MRWVICGLGLWGVIATAAAAVVVVEPGDSIQEAIDSAKDGDRIDVAPGEFSGPLDFRGKRVMVAGSGPQTVVRGAGSGSVVRFASGEDRGAVLDSMQITGGSTDVGGGIFIANASPTIQRCVIYGNQAQDQGAGIFVGGGASRPLIRNNILAFNLDPRPQPLSDAHQIYVDGGASAVIVNNTFVRGNGNAILLNAGPQPSVVVNNLLVWNGSQLANGNPTGRGICDFSGSARIRHNLFHGNRRSAILTGGFGDFQKVTDAERAIGEWRFRDNLDGNPRFRRAPTSHAAFDIEGLALRASSPARNAGDDVARFRDQPGGRPDLGHTGGRWGWR